MFREDITEDFNLTHDLFQLLRPFRYLVTMKIIISFLLGAFFLWVIILLIPFKPHGFFRIEYDQKSSISFKMYVPVEHVSDFKKSKCLEEWVVCYIYKKEGQDDSYEEWEKAVFN